MKSNGVVHPSTDRVFESRTGGKIADGFQSKIPADISERQTRSLSNIHTHLGPWHHLTAGAKTAAITFFYDREWKIVSRHPKFWAEVDRLSGNETYGVVY